MPSEAILKHLPPPLAEELARLGAYKTAEELRIRCGAPAMLYSGGREYITRYVPDADSVRDTLLSLCEHSLIAFSDDIRRGFFTAESGVRVGVAGRVVSERGSIRLIRDFSSLNIRFPRQIKGVSKSALIHLTEDGRLLSSLIISAPQHGKTTLLRDIIRAVSSGENTPPKKCAVIDERGELYALGLFDLGPRTDVLSYCPKAEGMSMALRSLSPDVIATDETGSGAELGALLEAGNSGVTVLATAHAGSLYELTERVFFRELCASGLIKRIMLLSDSLGRSTVERVYTGDGSVVCDQPERLCGSAVQ